MKFDELLSSAMKEMQVMLGKSGFRAFLDNIGPCSDWQRGWRNYKRLETCADPILKQELAYKFIVEDFWMLKGTFTAFSKAWFFQRTPDLCPAYDQSMYDLRHEQAQKWLMLDDVNKNNPKQNILLRISTGFSDLIPIALDKGYDANLKTDDGYGNTPLMWSIANDAKQTAIELIECCMQKRIPIDLNLESTFNGNTPLILALAKGHNRSGEISNFELTSYLLQKGADPNKADCNGFTPLHYAYLRRDLNTIQLLTTYGAQKSTLNNDGETPSDLLKWDYAKSRSKVMDITGGETQRACTFPDLVAFEEKSKACHSFHLQQLAKEQASALRQDQSEPPHDNTHRNI